MSRLHHNNELIRKRRKKKAIKKSIFLFILLVGILIILCLKLPYFDINSIEVKNNKNVTKEDVIKLSGIKKGSNIFYQNFGKSKKDIKKNPYIYKVKITRSLPNKVEVNVNERKAKFYIQIDSKVAIVDDESVVLEIKDKLTNASLVKIDGVNQSDVKLGKSIAATNDRKVKFIASISDLMDRSKSGVPQITKIDLSNSTNYKVYFSNIEVIVGNSFGLQDKLNKAINIIQSQGYKSLAGYIDVSFNGAPAVKINR